MFTGPPIATIMNGLRAGFEGGHLRPPPVQTWSLEQAVDAYTAVQAGALGSKHVLIPRLSGSSRGSHPSFECSIQRTPAPGSGSQAKEGP